MKPGTGGRQRAYKCTHLSIDHGDGESSLRQLVQVE